MSLIQKTITFPLKELEQELAKINQRIEALEQFELEVQDMLGFIPEDELEAALSEALERLDQRSRRGRS